MGNNFMPRESCRQRAPEQASRKQMSSEKRRLVLFFSGIEKEENEMNLGKAWDCLFTLKFVILTFYLRKEFTNAYINF